MGENRNYKKLIASCATVLCMAVVMILTVFYTDASDESTAIKYQEGYTWESKNYKDDKGAGIAPEAPEGYLFAGWYTKEGTTYKPVSNPVENANYYAKFVPEKVLGMKAQISKTLTDDNAENDGTTAAIRFVTSIDNSKAYKHVGFNIKKGSSGTAEDAKTTDYVYRTIYAVGATDSNGKAEDYVPEELFHEASYYFKTWTIGNIKEAAYNTEITVIPYWITLDGTRVEGTKAIKVATINLGRSWIYINETANEDGKQYGTKKHPYNDFATALDNIVLDKNGKVLLQGNYAVASNFDWKAHGKDITVTGVAGNELLDFSAKTQGTIRDGVTFANMRLKLFSAHVYAAGNRFEIAADVTSENPNTVIYGGAYGTSVKNTNVTIRSGSYMGIYGGGVNAGGTVTGDTHVFVENCSIFSKTDTHTRRVHGGGKKATVEGNTYVTIGRGFNAELGNDCIADSMYSTVYGGGFGETSNGTALRAAVEGNTYVTIKDGAGVNYVFGAGGPLSTVKGTSHIYFEGGQAMGVYGGSNSTDSVNSHTFIKMTGGTVEQIFGGNHKATGNMIGTTEEKVHANVQVLGGTVTRRIYGGCYNDYDGTWATTNSVNGYVSVTIGKDAIISNRSDSSFLGNDTSICSISRLADNAATEIGVMILNSGVNSSEIGMNIEAIGSSLSKALYTNFLVNVSEGGTVVSEGGVLHISADRANNYNYATVTYGDKVLGYVKGEGKCSLPELTDKATIQNIQVAFSETEPDTVTNNFVVKSILGENAAYYTSLEEAVENAVDDTEIVVLDNVSVNSPMIISKKLVLTSEKAVTITRGTEFTTGSMFEVTEGTFDIQGAMDARITIDGNVEENSSINVRAFYVKSGQQFNLEYATVQNFHTTGDGGGVRATANSVVNVQNCEFVNNQANVGGAMHVLKGVKATVNNCVYLGNSSTGNGGAVYCAGILEDTNSSYTENTGRNGGAIIAINGGQVTLAGTDVNAKFSANEATLNGNAIFVQNDGSVVSVSDYVFEGEVNQTVQVNGQLNFDNISGATFLQGSAGKLYVVGYEETNVLSVVPYAVNEEYAVGQTVLMKAQGVDGSVFQAACEGINVVPDKSEKGWWIQSDGTLMWGEACIDTTYYTTLEAAIDAINDNNDIGTTENIKIVVLRSVDINKTIEIKKDITLSNIPSNTITISRASNMTALMFKVASGASLTLGSNDANEAGQLIIDGYTASAIGTRIVDNYGNFTLSKNAVLTGANTNATPWGCALINRSKAYLYGSITDNKCAGASGAVLQHSGTIYIYEGTYTGNSATRSANNSAGASMGGFLRVYGGTAYIYGGNFADNSTTGNGGAIYIDKAKTAYITGGSFSGNEAEQGGNDIYVAGILNYTSSNVATSTDGVVGTGTINSDYSGQ